MKIYFDFLFESFHNEQIHAFYQNDMQNHLNTLEDLIIYEQQENRLTSSLSPSEISQDLMILAYGIITSYFIGTEIALLKKIWLRGIQRLFS